MNNEAGAIIIGGHFQGLGVMRALATKGVEVVLLDHEPCLARFSHYLGKYFQCPDIRDEKRFLDFLCRLVTRERLEGWVIFPTDDETVFFLSNHRDRLNGMYRITTPSWSVVKYAYNKKQSYRLAEKIGIPIPKTIYPENENDLVKIDHPFPLLVKPAVMSNFFRITGEKVFRARNYEELTEMYRKTRSIINPSEILIQEEIPDVSKNLYSFCPLFKDRKVLARITAKRSRQHPMDFGQASTFAETVNIPELEELGTHLLSAMDFYGLCEVEFIQDPRDGKFKFLEVNPRVWGWHTLAIRAGVNLPYLLYLDMLNEKVQNGYFKKGVKWVHLATDIPTVASEIAKGKMGLKEYLNSIKGEKEFAVFSMNDPLPFFGELFLIPYLWKRRGF